MTFKIKACLSSVAFVALGLSVLSPALWAGDDIGVRQGTTQADLERISADMVAAYNFKPLQPSAPMGVLGFHVNTFLSYTETEQQPAWERATGDSISELGMIGVGVGKGLIGGLDAGAFIADGVTSNVNVMGAELRYALAEGSVIGPALSVRASYTKLEGADNLDFDTRALDVSMSKGFVLATPYVGLGRVWGVAKPDVAGLEDEDVYETKYYGGVKLNLLLIQVTAELEKTGDNTVYAIRGGFGF